MPNVQGMDFEALKSVRSLAALGSAREVEALLVRTPAVVNEVDEETGATALLVACRRDHYGITAVLLEHGAAVNQANKLGWTPLMAAARFAGANVAQLLLKHQADPTAALSNGETAAELASNFHVYQLIEKAQASATPVEPTDEKA